MTNFEELKERQKKIDAERRAKRMSEHEQRKLGGNAKSRIGKFWKYYDDPTSKNGKRKFLVKQRVV